MSISAVETEFFKTEREVQKIMQMLVKIKFQKIIFHTFQSRHWIHHDGADRVRAHSYVSHFFFFHNKPTWINSPIGFFDKNNCGLIFWTKEFERNII